MNSSNLYKSYFQVTLYYHYVHQIYLYLSRLLPFFKNMFSSDSVALKKANMIHVSVLQ